MTPERWQQLTGLFHGALLRDRAERRAFLEDACGLDEPLRAEVEAMLAAHDKAGEPGRIPAVALSEPMLRLQLGSAVGRYLRLDAAASPVVICAARSFLGGAWAADHLRVV